MLHPPVTARPTSVLLVPDHRFLDLNDGIGKWNFTGVTNELNNQMLTGEAEQHLMVLLAFPDVSLNEVDCFALLECVNAFAKAHEFGVELITYAQRRTGPYAFSTLISSHNPLGRRLTVHVMASEVVNYFTLRWHTVLEMFGIKPNLPVRGNADAELFTLLNSGFSKPDLPYIYAVTPVGDGEMVIAGYPASGRTSA